MDSHVRALNGPSKKSRLTVGSMGVSRMQGPKHLEQDLRVSQRVQVFKNWISGALVLIIVVQVLECIISRYLDPEMILYYN